MPAEPSGAGNPRGERGDLGSVPHDRRIVTVLFADIVRSTELISSLDPEAGTAVLLPLVNAMSDAVERYGGTITHRMGDGLMGAFGVPVVQEDHAVRACHAALLIQKEIGRLSRELAPRSKARIQARVGLNSGSVVLTTSTDRGRVTYDALGPTTHLASRMETAAEPGTIVVSEHTARHVRHLFECTPMGTRLLKGFNDPQPVYGLAGEIAQSRAKRAPSASIAQSALVGRTRELGEIKARFEALDAGEGSLILLSGEPGLGKTRLLQEAKGALKHQAIWLEGHALSFGQRLSYWPFIEMLKPWLGFQEAADAGENWRRAELKIREVVGEESAEVLPYIATLVGLDLREPYGERVRYLDAESLGGQILRAAWRLFAGMARRAPVVAVIDDLHWIDGSSAALVEHLLPLARESPILFFLTSRPDGGVLTQLRATGEQVAGLHISALSLAPLSVQESQRLITAMIGDRPETAHVRDMILYKAEGNPFFAEEIVRTLIDAKVLLRDESGWKARDQVIKIPDTVDGVIMARVDRLDDRLKEVLGIASVIGRSFFYRVLRAVTEHGEDLDDRLSKLKAVEIIDELKSAPELAYLFRHALAQEAVYESVLIQRRKSIHERVAECIEVLFKDRLREVASLLAFHYARAENWPKALHFLLEAAEQSSRMAADDEALIHYQEAVDAYARVFGETWEKGQRAAIERRLGEIYLRRGGHAQALAHLNRALSAFGATIPSSKAGIRLRIARELGTQIAHRLLAPLILKTPSAAINPDHETFLGAFECAAWTMLMLDQRRLAAVAFMVLNFAERIAFAEAIAKASSAFGFGLDCFGFHGLARFYHRRAIRLSEELGNPSAMGIAWNVSGVHEFLIGRWDEAIARYDRGRDFSNRAGDLSNWSDASILKCEVLSEQGRFEEALAIAEEMLDCARETGFQAAFRWGITSKGKALRRLGRLAECEPALRAAVERSLQSSDFVNLGPALGELAFFLIQRGCHDEARRMLADCHRALRQHGTITYTTIYPRMGSALLELSELERSAGRDAGVRRDALRACRQACAASRTFLNGLPHSTRLLGTAAWIDGRSRKAAQWWQRSIDAAERLGARYSLALTLIERGRRMQSSRDLERGRSIIAGLGADAGDDETVPLL